MCLPYMASSSWLNDANFNIVYTDKFMLIHRNERRSDFILTATNSNDFTLKIIHSSKEKLTRAYILKLYVSIIFTSSKLAATCAI